MNKVLDKLPALVAEELEAANAENPPFHSLHEGWAVLKEEIDETQEALDCVENHLIEMWTRVRDDDLAVVRTKAVLTHMHAVVVAAEAIQVAAMAQKLLDYIDTTKEVTP